MPRKISIKGWDRKLNPLIRQIVIARDEGCVTCPLWRKIKPDYMPGDVLQGGHLFTRGAKSVKYDLKNVYCQCNRCNFLHEYHPDILTSYVLTIIGQEGYDRLVINRHTIKKWTASELELLYGTLEKVLQSYGSN